MLSLAKIFFVLAVLMAMVLFRLDLGLAIFVSAVFLGVLFAMPWTSIVMEVPRSVLSGETLLLALALILILAFNDLWRESGRLKRAARAFEHYLRDARATVMVLPAIIGLMPIMGGAYLSAPLVDAASRRLRLTPEHKSFLNYWFRHIWEYFLPTYPGVLVAASIYGCAVPSIILHNIGLTVASVAGGLAAGLYGIRANARTAPAGKAPAGLGEFLWDLTPLGVLLGLALALKFEKAPTSLGIDLATLAAMAAAMVMFRLPWGKLPGIFRRSFSWSMTGIVFAVMFFKAILEQSGAIVQLSAEFQRLGLPVEAIAVVIPFLIGFLTGITVAFVGIAFPIIVSISPDLALLPLAYAAGYCGVLLSPTHLCLLMTRDYFKSGFLGIYLRMIVPLAAVFGTGVALYFLFR